MQRVFVLITIFSLKLISVLGQTHWEWVHKDDSLIKQVKSVVLKSPLEVESYFKKNGYRSSIDSLGFNWVKKELKVAGGYISFYADFYYLRDTLKTLILWSYLPDENSINKSYQKAYSSFLPIDSGGAMYYTYQPENLLRPLSEYSLVKNHINPSFELLNYMSPSSDLYYGYRGGISMSILPNRETFNSIRRKLTRDEVIAIMYSINPASRLTAIEFFFKNKSRFKTTEEIKNWVSLVYAQKPKIETMNGCIVDKENSASLVQKFVKSSFK